MFKNEYSQFFKMETDFVKYWTLNPTSTLVAHLNAGVIWSYGNSSRAPYTEMFYVEEPTASELQCSASVREGRIIVT